MVRFAVICCCIGNVVVPRSTAIPAPVSATMCNIRLASISVWKRMTHPRQCWSSSTHTHARACYPCCYHFLQHRRPGKGNSHAVHDSVVSVTAAEAARWLTEASSARLQPSHPRNGSHSHPGHDSVVSVSAAAADKWPWIIGTGLPGLTGAPSSSYDRNSQKEPSHYRSSEKEPSYQPLHDRDSDEQPSYVRNSKEPSYDDRSSEYEPSYEPLHDRDSHEEPSYESNSHEGPGWPECQGVCLYGHCALRWHTPACCYVPGTPQHHHRKGGDVYAMSYAQPEEQPAGYDAADGDGYVVVAEPGSADIDSWYDNKEWFCWGRAE